MKANNKLSELLAYSNQNIAASFTDISNIENVKRAFENGLNIAEIRLDLFEDISENHLTNVIKSFTEFPTILTIRSNKEGGKWNGLEQNRLNLYRKLIPLVDAVDIELISDEILDDVVTLANENNVNVIISHHNFERTPDSQFLENVIDNAINRGADIVKIATFIREEKDILTLQNLLADKDENLVIIGMGEKGIKTRTDFPKLGSKFTFVNVEQSTAPGQINLSEMVKALKT